MTKKRRRKSFSKRPLFHPQGPTLQELLRQALSSTDRGYDLLAPKFEFTPFRTPDPFIRASLPEEFRGAKRAASAKRSELEGGPDRSSPPAGGGFRENLPKRRAALDLCCGTGAALHILSSRFDQVAGIDRSAGMLEEARRRVPNAELHRGDVLSLPDALKGRFDVVTCYGAFGHIRPRDEPALCDAAWAALRPGGSFVFVTSTKPPLTSPSRWIAEGFNAAMHVRNALFRPPFVMFYLTFLLPRARMLLEARGFEVDHRPIGVRLYAVEARKPEHD